MRTALALALCLVASLASAQIPIPPGLRVATSVVMPTSDKATDTNNPRGTIDKPRLTIPNPVPAGSIVDLIGPYATSHTSPNGLKVNGTAAAPVVIRSAIPSAPSVLSGGWEVSATYATFEGLKWTGGLNLVAPNDHAHVRDSFVQGNGATCLGMGINSYSAAVNTYVDVYRVTSSNHGNLKTTVDQDCHGLNIGARADHIWVTESQFERNSGDGIQINATADGRATTHHIIVARNVAAFNKQTGFWVKQASDVLFLGNVSHDHRPSNSSLGQCMGGQYGPERIWWIANEVYNCDVGIQLASDSGAGDGTQIAVAANSIHDIRSSGPFDPTNPWQSCAISLMGGKARTVLYNSLNNVESGICSGPTGTTNEGGDAVYGGLRVNGVPIFGPFRPIDPVAAWTAMTTSMNTLYGTTF